MELTKLKDLKSAVAILHESPKISPSPKKKLNRALHVTYSKLVICCN